MNIAVLGMGRMGQAIAGRLLDSDHDVTVWNRTPRPVPRLEAAGAKTADSVAAAVADAELAITVLADDRAVMEVALGEGGVRASLAAGATLVDSSTVAPSTSEELEGAFPRFVAMPVLGSPSQVSSGQAVFLVGAAGETADAIEALFPALSERHIRYFRPGAAAAAKLTVNLLLLDGVVALAEAMAAGRAGGLSDDQLRELLGESPMVAPGLRYRFEGILTGQQEPLWTTVLGAKDARLVVEMAQAAGTDLPLTARARQLYDDSAALDDRADIASVAGLYRRTTP